VAEADKSKAIDLVISNINREMFSLYRNSGQDYFDDVAAPTGVGQATFNLSGWGLKFFDYDNDGTMDLLLANGHPDLMIEKWSKHPVTYEEPMKLLRNMGKTWSDISAESGPIFSRNLAARGLALGDFDNNGSVDVLVTVNDGAPILLRNNAARGNHWLGVRLIGKRANIDAIGAKLSYGSGQWRRQCCKVGGGSFMSAHDPRIVLGLDQHTKLDWLEVHWPNPSGKIQRFTNLPIDRYITIVEGEGVWK